jgi:Mg2+ transporter MgtE
MEDVVDKQVIDIENRKVIRVNDVLLEYAPRRLTVLAVCVGADSFLRRLFGDRPSALVRRLFRTTEKVIDWHLVQPLGSSSSSLRLTVSWNKTAPFHPADLADLMEDLDSHEQMAILSTLDNEKAADTIAKIEEDDLATSILRRMDPDKASDIVEEMSPDDAADILSDLPKPSADAILSGMEQPSRASVRRLMEYDGRTAGGIMTTEYVAVPTGVTVDQTIRRIREVSEEAETIYYGYVVDPEHRLVGVFSLRDLIVAQPGDDLAKVMTTPVIHVLPDVSDGEVVDIMSKYDLLALPVTDAGEHLLGIITVDDVVDVLMERGAWIRVMKRR